MNERIKQLIKSRGIILESEHFEIVELMVDEFIQLLEQSKLIQVLLFTFDRINAAGCGPNPSLKLIPTPEIK